MVATYDDLAGPGGRAWPVPIGRPLPGARAPRPRPAGASRRRPARFGELCLGGPGVARGYLGPARPHRRALRARSVRGAASPAPASTAPATCARLPAGRRPGVPRPRSTSRSRSAASASSPARSRRALAAHPAVREAARGRWGRRAGGARLRRLSWCRAAAVATRRPLRRLPAPAGCRSTMVPALFVLWPPCRSPPTGKLDRRALAAPEPALAEAAGGGSGRRATPVEERAGRHLGRGAGARTRRRGARRLLRPRRPFAPGHPRCCRGSATRLRGRAAAAQPVRDRDPGRLADLVMGRAARLDVDEGGS